jgi:hypothetical protein
MLRITQVWRPFFSTVALLVGVGLVLALALASPTSGQSQLPETAVDDAVSGQAFPQPLAERQALSSSVSGSGSTAPQGVPASTWKCDPSGGPACFSTLSSIAMASPQEGWAVGGGMTLHYQDGRWQNVSSYSPSVVTTDPSGQAWALYLSCVRWSGAECWLWFLRFTGNGWQAAGGEYGYGLPTSLAMVSPEEGWAVSSGGGIYHYTGGAGVQVSGTFAYGLNSVAALPSGEAWAVGQYGTILHHDGRNWHNESGPTSNQLNSLSMVSSSDGWAVGDAGVILHYDGTDWRVVDSPTASRLRTVSMVNAWDGWAAGDNGTLVHYSGGRWERASSPTASTISSLANGSPQEGWRWGRTAPSCSAASMPGPDFLVSATA